MFFFLHALTVSFKWCAAAAALLHGWKCCWMLGGCLVGFSSPQLFRVQSWCGNEWWHSSDSRFRFPYVIARLNLSLVKMSYGDMSLFVHHDHTIACLQRSWVYNRAWLCISHRGLALGSEGENIFLIHDAEVRFDSKWCWIIWLCSQITPIMGAVGLILMIVLCPNPPRGAAETHGEGVTEQSSYLEDVKYLLKKYDLYFALASVKKPKQMVFASKQSCLPGSLTSVKVTCGHRWEWRPWPSSPGRWLSGCRTFCPELVSIRNSATNQVTPRTGIAWPFPHVAYLLQPESVQFWPYCVLSSASCAVTSLVL